MTATIKSVLNDLYNRGYATLSKDDALLLTGYERLVEAVPQKLAALILNELAPDHRIDGVEIRAFSQHVKARHLGRQTRDTVSYETVIVLANFKHQQRYPSN